MWTEAVTVSENFFFGYDQKNSLDLHLQCYGQIQPMTIDDIFSSPELKAQGELLWSLTVRRRRRPYVRPSVGPSIRNL